MKCDMSVLPASSVGKSQLSTEIDGKNIFFVDGAEKHMALAACFDLDIDEAFVKQLADYEPLRVVFRDAGFASDSVKINVEQIFAQKSPNIEVKVL